MWQLNLSIENQNILLTENDLLMVLQDSKKDAQLDINKLLEKLLSYLSIFLGNSKNQLSGQQLSDLINKLLIEENYSATALQFNQNFQKILAGKNTQDLVEKIDQPSYSKATLERIKKAYMIGQNTASNLDQISDNLARANHQDNNLKNSISKLIAEKKFLPHQNILKNKHPYDQVNITLEDDLNNIFDHLKSASINFQNNISTSINFSKLRPKHSLIKSTLGVSAGPVTFMKIYTSTFEALRQTSSQDFLPQQNFLLSIDHPDILEFLIFAKNFPKNSLYSNSNFTVILSPNFLEAVLKDEEYELINPENQQVVNFLSAKNTFDLLASSLQENSQLGLISHQYILENQKTISGYFNLANYAKSNFSNNVLLEDLKKINQFLKLQNLTNSYQIKIYLTGIIDLLIRQKLTLNSIHAIEFLENLFGEMRSNLDKETILTISNQNLPVILLENSNGLESIAHLTFTKTSLDGQEMLYCQPELKNLLSENNLYTNEIVAQIHEYNSLEPLFQIPQNLKNIIKTNWEIPIELQLNLQKTAEKNLQSAIEKEIYINQEYNLEKLKKIILDAFKNKLSSFRFCHFENQLENEDQKSNINERSFLIDSRLAKKRKHREIQPPLFQIKKTEEIPLPPIST